MLLVDNPKGELLPGMYARVRFALPHMVSVMMLPADALVLKTDGPHAAVVGADHKVHFHKLVLGRDLGSELEVNSGLEEGDAVVLNPTDCHPRGGGGGDERARGEIKNPGSSARKPRVGRALEPAACSQQACSSSHKSRLRGTLETRVFTQTLTVGVPSVFWIRLGAPETTKTN